MGFKMKEQTINKKALLKALNSIAIEEEKEQTAEEYQEERFRKLYGDLK